ncbi:eukaryotic translation initiation factor 5A-1-like [Mercenaria mercenaria]|uniref:eukaryotic translation initiation factor 5A-1-like n=1 Tax=Mercenaria mercenaria TaxID=6596 RepID=UPI00234EBB67|nr:eukaryotic translation initiation factor 5A-1-like [Mercenaria mercenaria]
MTKNLRAAKNFTNRLVDENSPPMSFDDAMDDLESGDAEMSLTRPVKASALRKNGHVMLHGNPCKIVDMATSRPGKHGHAKIHITGLDLVTGKKYEDISPSTHTMEVPISNRKEYLVVDMGREGVLALMDDAGFVRHDIQATDDDMKKNIADKLAKQDDQDVLVTVLKVLDKELVMAVKTGVK